MFLQVQWPRSSWRRAGCRVTFPWRTCRFGGSQTVHRHKEIIRSQKTFLKPFRLRPGAIRDLVSLAYIGRQEPSQKEKRHSIERLLYMVFPCRFASNPHGHDDVAVAVGLVGERPHLPCGLL